MDKQPVPTRPVFLKIASVRASVGPVPKEGFNDSQKYRYQDWQDVLATVRDACVSHGLLIVQSVPSFSVTEILDKSGRKPSVLTTCVFDLIDADSGDTLSVPWIGQAVLSDDKALNRASTAAYKYFCLKLFQITTKGDEDPDAEPRSRAPGRRTADGIARAQSYAAKRGVDWGKVESYQDFSSLSLAELKVVIDSLAGEQVASGG